MALKDLLRTTERCVHASSRACTYLSIATLFLMTLFMATDVLGRYLFSKPIAGSIDFVTVMMVLLVAPSLGFVTSQDGHVRTDILYDRLSRRTRGLFDVFNAGLSLFLVALIAWQLGARAWSILKNPPGISTSYFQWPHLPFIGLTALGCTLMALELALWLFRAIGDAIGRGESIKENVPELSSSEAREERVTQPLR